MIFWCWLLVYYGATRKFYIDLNKLITLGNEAVNGQSANQFFSKLHFKMFIKGISLLHCHINIKYLLINNINLRNWFMTKIVINHFISTYISLKHAIYIEKDDYSSKNKYRTFGKLLLIMLINISCLSKNILL